MGTTKSWRNKCVSFFRAPPPPMKKKQQRAQLRQIFMGGHKNVYDLHNLTAQAGPQFESCSGPRSPCLLVRLALGGAQDIVIHKEYVHFLLSLPHSLPFLLCVCVDKEHINYGTYIMEIYRCCHSSPRCYFMGPAEFYDPWQSRLFIDLLDGVANFAESLSLSVSLSLEHVAHGAVRSIKDNEPGQDRSREQAQTGRQSLIVLDLWPSLIRPATRVDTSTTAFVSPSPFLSLSLSLCLPLSLPSP